MNSIQRALAEQNISAAWNGDEPQVVEIITDSYLNNPIFNGLPRMVRTQGDAGNDIDIEKLRIDYARFSREQAEEKRIADIKDAASRTILNQYPNWKQANMSARFAELTGRIALGETLSDPEKDELSAVKAAWTWIHAVRTTSDEAEVNGTLAQHITWPTLT
jgi:hypothetical protein